MNSVMIELLDKNDLIMIDTCFAMNDEFEDFISSLESELVLRKRKIIVKSSVMAELRRNMRSEDECTKTKAENAFYTIDSKRNILAVSDNYTTPEETLRAFADVEFLSDFTKNRIKYRMALLTNDYKLGKDICNLNKVESCYGNKVEVYYFNSNGCFEERVYNESLDKSFDVIIHNKTQEKIKKVRLELEPIKPTVNKMVDNDMTLVEGTESNKHKQWFLVAIVSVVSLSAGFVFGKWGKTILRNLL